jgi:hypothetical protein
MAHPVIAMSPIQLEADDDVVTKLGDLAAGRPLVIDFSVTSVRGVTVGDLTLVFGTEHLRPGDVELAPVAGVRVLVDPHLLELLAEGARLRWRRGLLRRHLVVSLARPE